jgi:hypothetical protein
MEENWLKKYTDAKVEALASLMNERSLAHTEVHKMLARELERARGELRERLHGMNEFRATLEKQSNTFVTREMLEAREELRKRDGNVLFARVLGGVVVVVAIIEVIFRFAFNG